MEIALQIIGWMAWVVTSYFAITFAYGCRLYARRGIGFQWATALQTMLFWVAAIVFLTAPVSKLHLIWIVPLIFTDQLVLWLIRRGLPERAILYIPSPIRILLWVPLTKLVIFLFMQGVLLGIRTPSATEGPSPNVPGGGQAHSS